MKDIRLADEAGFCFGVKRAVDITVSNKTLNDKGIYTLGPLIHNNDVVKKLENQDIKSIDIENIDKLDEKDTIIIRSHGVKPEVMELLNKKNLNIIDATCPYVTTIQKKVEKYSSEGYNIIIVGDKNHPEVIGINGFCKDSAIISKDGSNIPKLKGKTCIVCQTTEKQENFNKVLNVVQSKCEDVVALNTICSATDVRQKAADKLSKEVDAMIVIGGKNSSNTRKLYEICKNNCEKTFHIENVTQLSEELRNNNYKIIGVTAGASTPNWAIEEVIKKMQDINEKEVCMDEQLRFMEENELEIYTGKVISGEIISINKKEAFINLNYKNDGVLPISEVSSENDVDLTDILKIGDIVKCKVIKVKDSDGNVVLSTKELEREEGYKVLKNAFENKEILKVKVKEDVKGGFICNFKGIKVFLPSSLARTSSNEDVKVLIGTEIDVHIIEFSKVKNNTKIVVSRRSVVEERRSKLQEEAWKDINKDTVVEGVVKRINDFGAFVEVNGIDGLLHISEISWGKVQSVKSKLKIGDNISVYVLEADKENNKLSLSLKRLSENPWNNIEEKYPVGTIVLGKVIRFAKFGAFVELEPGVDALLHISQISHNRVENVADVLKLDDSIKVKILEVDPEKKKISISTKDLMEI